MQRSLVLGGGGVVGVSWLVGMLSGLADAGIDLSVGANGAPDEVIGTSAGSIVGALLARGGSLASMHASALDDSLTVVVGEASASLDIMLLIECFEAWAALPDSSPASLAGLGAFALKASTIDEARWVGSLTESVGTQWPHLPYRCSAVNAETGQFVLWGNDSAVSLDSAVASSCAVPVIFPPVTINGGRYMDGGVSSATCADAAFGNHVLVLAPIGSFAGDTMDALAARLLASEVASLEARGARVVWTFPDDETNAATLSTPLGRMDPDMRSAAIEHGIRQGKLLAEHLAHW